MQLSDSRIRTNFALTVDSLDTRLQMIRAQNREELTETDNRIRSIQRELEDMKRPTIRDYSLMATK
jgi:hypothetical protein